MGLSILSILALAINVAVASDLSFPIKEIIQAYQQQTGNEVRLTLGSSGNFFAQVQNGAPFDVFLVPAVSGVPKDLREVWLHAE